LWNERRGAESTTIMNHCKTKKNYITIKSCHLLHTHRYLATKYHTWQF
jgi:hypothetical protein